MIKKHHTTGDFSEIRGFCFPPGKLEFELFCLCSHKKLLKKCKIPQLQNSPFAEHVININTVWLAQREELQCLSSTNKYMVAPFS